MALSTKGMASIFLKKKYDRNSNLNSHTHVYFEDLGDRTHILIEEVFFWRRDYHLTKYPSDKLVRVKIGTIILPKI